MIALAKRASYNPEAIVVQDGIDFLKFAQNFVGGYIETVIFRAEKIPYVVICNEEERLMGLPYNCTIGNVDFCGDILIVGIDGSEFSDIPHDILLYFERNL